MAQSELADAMMRGETGRLASLLADGAAIDAAQADGTTALHWAVFDNDAAAVRLLIEAGATLDASTRTGMTPLLLAAEAGNAEIARLLLVAGANFNLAFRNGETPLMMAARTGDPATIDALIDAGAPIDATESLRGTTALMWAAAYSNPEAVSRLIERGADFSLRSATVSAGRGPYLAPTPLSRINEYLRGAGQAGASEDQDGISEEARAASVSRVVGILTDLGLIVEEEEDGTGFRARLPEEIQGDDVSPITGSCSAVATDDPTAPVFIDSNPDLGREDEATLADNGGLTALILAAREGDLDSARILVEAGADVNQTSEYCWTPLLTAVQNRYYELAIYLLDQGADPNIANKGGWSPLYIATDNRNIEGGDYPTRHPDIDHLALIRRLLDDGADPNIRMASSTETRTIFTHQWLREEGATPFLRAAQSGDLELIELLLEHGADPSIPTVTGVTPLMVASGIGWVEGVTFEWSREQTLAVMQRLIELGADVNAQDFMDFRTALMGAAHKGHTEGVQLLVDTGADLAIRDIGSRDSIHKLAGARWQAIDYAEGLVRVGVQSAIEHPETAALIRRLMLEQGLDVPPEGRTLESICVVEICQ